MVEHKYVASPKRYKKSPEILNHHDTMVQVRTPSLVPSSPNQDQSQEQLLSDHNSIMDLASSSSSSDLPWSFMVDVLSRFPLNLLMQFSYVCKSWRNLLRESYFCRRYSLYASTTLLLPVDGSSLDSMREIHLIEPIPSLSVLPPQSQPRQRPWCIRKMKLKQGVDVEDLNLLFDKEKAGGKSSLPEFKFQLGNGCDGLICLTEIETQEPKLVWNPVMRQFVVLPKSGSLADDDKVVTGFGFCSRTNRYKVVRVFHRVMDPPKRFRVQIYDLGVGQEWRDIGDAPFQIPSKIPGFYTNCCLHWIVKQNSDLICCFDFVEECFKSISPPPIYSPKEKNKYYWSNLGILGGCGLSISAIDAKLFRPDFQVWVMEEYGVAESWALRLSIRDPAVHWWDPYRWIQVINFLENGEVLILCGHCFVLAYDVGARLFRSVERLVLDAVAHVPSFVSLEDVLRDDLGTGSLNVEHLKP